MDGYERFIMWLSLVLEMEPKEVEGLLWAGLLAPFFVAALVIFLLNCVF